MSLLARAEVAIVAKVKSFRVESMVVRMVVQWIAWLMLLVWS